MDKPTTISDAPSDMYLLFVLRRLLPHTANPLLRESFSNRLIIKPKLGLKSSRYSTPVYAELSASVFTGSINDPSVQLYT
ncbi:uncharacterized protein ACHE_31352A [Aspergillus chevalieri]|uniref:Uncharacterized protein n=1 Tax=Aspergillus chevalieri TaxID=182096 RepID=A0A7R7ZM02_ASPCH|nr:uncharacterized protein ACHE_31352A [Aspergillus chevalieri]BCR87365.1 hypothetical protein ACHE_31352A [Aspergillus chevalieri]